MEEQTLIGLGTVVVFGIGAIWLARRLRLPAILFLLAAGILAGPLGGLLDPNQLFGDLLFPGVELAVGLLLFQAGLGLRVEHLRRGTRGPVLRLVTLGVGVTWMLAAVTIALLFDESRNLALLIGAILVVSGPTVVGPLLKLARPREPAGSILEWEGIVIDPIGATLAIVLFNGLFLSEGEFWEGVVSTFGVGVAAGALAAALLVTALRRFLVPDELEVAVALLFVVAAYTGAELVRSDAGLFATTTVGVAMGNQRAVPTGSLQAFGRTLEALIIGSLFVVLGALVDLQALWNVLPQVLGLVAVLVLLVRPLVVALCTVRSGTTWRDRAFIAGVAPRGIVAASTASLFAVKLQAAGQSSDLVVPVVFGVIIGAGFVYGLGTVPLARLLGVAKPPPRGIVLVGEQPWVAALAEEIGRAGVPALVAAPGADEPVGKHQYRLHNGLLVDLSQRGALDEVAWGVVAISEEELRQVALPVLVETIGRQGVFLVPTDDPEPGERHDAERWARAPFGEGVTALRIDRAFADGGRVRTVEADGPLGEGAIALVTLRPDGTLDPAPGSGRFAAGERLVVLDPVRGAAPSSVASASLSPPP